MGLAQHLNGVTVLVTADRRSGELTNALLRRGATIRHTPTLTITPTNDDEQLFLATKQIIENPPEIVVATTAVGFRSWVDSAESNGLGEVLLKVLANAEIIARGPKARGAIQTVGLQAAWVAQSETSRELAGYLLSRDLRGKRIAIQHHGSGADGIDDLFAEAGAEVSSLVVYRWGPPKDPLAVEREVINTALGQIDAVVFTSAPGADAWLQEAKRLEVLPQLQKLVTDGHLLLASVGPVTAGPLLANGLTPLVPARGRMGALIKEIIDYYANSNTMAINIPSGRLIVHANHAVLNDAILDLSPTNLSILKLLALSPGAVITRHQILQAIPGRATTAHAADVCISRVREALGDKTTVETVIKRGYRLSVS